MHSQQRFSHYFVVNDFTKVCEGDLIWKKWSLLQCQANATVDYVLLTRHAFGKVAKSPPMLRLLCEQNRVQCVSQLAAWGDFRVFLESNHKMFCRICFFKMQCDLANSPFALTALSGWMVRPKVPWPKSAASSCAHLWCNCTLPTKHLMEMC